MEYINKFTGSELAVSFMMSCLFAFACAHFAEKKNRSSLGWFILGFAFNLIALIALYFLSPLKKLEKEKKMDRSSGLPPPFPIDTTEIVEENELKNALWFYLDDKHQSQGPVSLIALRELWATNGLTLRSYVWRASLPAWERVEKFPKLIELLNDDES